MRWRAACVGVVTLAVFGASGSAVARELLVLTPATPSPVSDVELVEVLAIYTRDLGYVVRTRQGAPPAVTPESLAEVATLLDASGAHLALWYELQQDGGERTVLLHTLARDGRARSHPLRLTGPGATDLYRTAALTVRTLLTGLDRESVRPPPVEARAAPATAPTAAPVAPLPAQVAGPIRVAAGYRLVLPLDPALLRHALFLAGSLRWRWLELHLGVELPGPVERSVREGTAMLLDVPLRAGARWRGTRGRLGLATGPALSLHVLHATATGWDGRHGVARRAAAGLGGDVVGEARITEHMSMSIGILVEYVLPEERFLVAGELAIPAGGLAVGLSAALSFAP